MLILLITRFLFSKTEKGPDTLLSRGYVWYDQNNPSASSNYDFLDYKLFNTDVSWFNYCANRDSGPDRTIVALAPSGNAIINDIKASLDVDLASYNLTVQVYESRDAIMKVIGGSSYEKNGEDGICFGAALVSDSSDNYQVNYIFDDITTERTQDSNMPNQELPTVDQYIREPDFESWNQYKRGGHTYMQTMFSNAILRNKTGLTTSYISMIYAPIKSSLYNSDDFITAANDMWSFFILLIFLAPLYRFVANSVNEKETKTREAMKVMGLTDSPYWLSWLTYYLIVNTIQC